MFGVSFRVGQSHEGPAYATIGVFFDVVEIARAAEWRHFPAVKQTFAAVDYAASTKTLIFDIGGNKYRLVARVDFEEQGFFIQNVMTH